MVDYQTISIVLTGLSISLAAFYYINTLRNTEKNQKHALETRQTQLQLNILAQTRTMEFLSRYLDFVYGQEFSTYEEWIEKYGPRTNPTAYVTYVYVTGMYQNLGYLLKRNVLSAEEIAEQIRPMSFITLWNKIEPIVKRHRETINPKAYDCFEYLATEMSKILEQNKALVRKSG